MKDEDIQKMAEEIYPRDLGKQVMFCEHAVHLLPRFQSLLQSREDRIKTLQLEINRLRIKYEHI